jgi:hypothetical protein
MTESLAHFASALPLKTKYSGQNKFFLLFPLWSKQSLPFSDRFLLSHVNIIFERRLQE